MRGKRTVRTLVVLGALWASAFVGLAPASGSPGGCDAGSLKPETLYAPPDSPLNNLPDPPPGSCDGIRPGAFLNGCTMNWVFRDAEGDVYVGTAGHCTRVGKRMSATGVGEFGTTVVRVFDPDVIPQDFALVRVDDDKKVLVNPTLCRFGGPIAVTPIGVPGVVYRHYGWGAETRGSDDERARSGTEVAPPTQIIAWEGRVSSGDSGSPVMSATGVALGYATRVFRQPLTASPEVGIGLGIGVSLSHALGLASAAGYDLEVVTGEAPRPPALADDPEDARPLGARAANDHDTAGDAT